MCSGGRCVQHSKDISSAYGPLGHLASNRIHLLRFQISFRVLSPHGQTCYVAFFADEADLFAGGSARARAPANLDGQIRAQGKKSPMPPSSQKLFKSC